MKRKTVSVRGVPGAIGRAVVWLLVLALAAVPAVFMNSIYGYFPLLFVPALTLVSLVCMLILRRRLTVSSALADLECPRGSHIDLGLALENRSVLTSPRASATVFISDLFGGADAERALSFTVGPNSSLDLGVGLDMEHVGVYRVGLGDVKISDFLGLMRCRVPLDGSFEAVVTPVLRSLDMQIDFDRAFAESNRDTSVTAVGGTDYTGVREYVPGDPMKQIHWKLSAHSRDYLTKLHERSQQQRFTVVLDFAAEDGCDRETLMDLNDCLVETALSLVEMLAGRDAETTLVYCDRAGQIARTGNTAPDNHAELVRDFSVITPAPDTAYPDSARILRHMPGRGSNLVVVTSRVTGELQHELLDVLRQDRGAALYAVVPASWTSRDIEKLHADMHLLEAAELPFVLVSTAENH